MQVALPQQRYADAAKRYGILRCVVADVRAIRGFEAPRCLDAAVSSPHPGNTASSSSEGQADHSR